MPKHGKHIKIKFSGTLEAKKNHQTYLTEKIELRKQQIQSYAAQTTDPRVIAIRSKLTTELKQFQKDLKLIQEDIADRETELNAIQNNLDKSNSVETETLDIEIDKLEVDMPNLIIEIHERIGTIDVELTLLDIDIPEIQTEAATLRESLHYALQNAPHSIQATLIKHDLDTRNRLVGELRKQKRDLILERNHLCNKISDKIMHFPQT